MNDDQKTTLLLLYEAIGALDIQENQKHAIQTILDMLYIDDEIDVEKAIDIMIKSNLNPVILIPGLSKMYEEEYKDEHIVGSIR